MPLTDRLALQDWPHLARIGGIDPAPYRHVRSWIKDERHRAQVTLRLEATGLPGLVAKQIYLPESVEDFEALVTAQKRAAQALAGHEFAHVPRIVAEDASRRMFLMDEAPGETLATLFETRPHPELLTRAGAWLAAFHRAQPTEPRRFQPRYMANHLAQLAAKTKDGKLIPAEPARFLRLIEIVRAMAPMAQDAATLSAVRHGDPIARNLILDGPRTWGIDFSAEQSAPVGYDIARFLLDYAWSYSDLDSLEKGELVPDAALGAFFAGYDLVPRQDGALAFLLPVRLLSDWASLPARPEARSLSKAVQFARMQRIAEVAFG